MASPKQTDAKAAIKNIEISMSANRDMRQSVDDAFAFVDKEDGQWEQSIVNRMRGKPRYTDDRVNPIINQIAGELESAQFAIKIRPADGAATMQLAQLRDGIVRHIRNISGADATTSLCARRLVKGGFAAVLIEHDYFDDDSFDQDLLIKPIHDAHTRVWLDPADQTNDGSGADWGVVLQFMPTEEFKNTFPEAACSSLSTARWMSRYYHKAETVVFAHYYYIETRKATLYRMSDGKVLKSDTVTEDTLQGLADKGIFVDDTREVEDRCCYFRMLGADGWLSEPEKTVFDCIPIVPAYGYFEVSESKILYRGATQKLMDVQRVHNYAFSREVEEVALAPRKKIMMTEEQGVGHEKSIQSMNTNMDPVQFYNHVPDQPPPFEAGAPNVNMAVSNLVMRSDESISKAAGVFAANLGANTQLQSGAALEKQIDRGNNGTSVYFEAMAVFIKRIGCILNKAIPKVYDATRQLRIINESGSFDTVVLNEIITGPGGQETTLNDLSQGKFDVVCDVGAAYKNRQQEAVDVFLKAMERDPNLINVAGDVFMKNINAPGFDVVAKRVRSIAIKNGVVLPEEMTEQEMAEFQQAQQQPKGPSAEEMQMKIAMLQAETAHMAQQNQAQAHQIRMYELQSDTAMKQKKTEDQLAVNAEKLKQSQQRVDQEGVLVQLQAQQQNFNNMLEMMKAQNDKVESLSKALLNIKNAMGVDVVVSQPTAKAYKEISEEIVEEPKIPGAGDMDRS